MPVNVAILGVPSVHWHALSRRPTSVSTLVMLKLHVWNWRDLRPPPRRFVSGLVHRLFPLPMARYPPSDVVLQSTLATQVELMQGCLEQVGSFLERAEAALSRLSVCRPC
jgi:hypothetical protein